MKLQYPGLEGQVCSDRVCSSLMKFFFVFSFFRLMSLFCSTCVLVGSLYCVKVT